VELTASIVSVSSFRCLSRVSTREHCSFGA